MAGWLAGTAGSACCRAPAWPPEPSQPMRKPSSHGWSMPRLLRAMMWCTLVSAHRMPAAARRACTGREGRARRTGLSWSAQQVHGSQGAGAAGRDPAKHRAAASRATRPPKQRHQQPLHGTRREPSQPRLEVSPQARQPVAHAVGGHAAHPLLLQQLQQARPVDHGAQVARGSHLRAREAVQAGVGTRAGSLALRRAVWAASKREGLWGATTGQLRFKAAGAAPQRARPPCAAPWRRPRAPAAPSRPGAAAPPASSTRWQEGEASGREGVRRRRGGAVGSSPQQQMHHAAHTARCTAATTLPLRHTCPSRSVAVPWPYTLPAPPAPPHKHPRSYRSM